MASLNEESTGHKRQAREQTTRANHTMCAGPHENSTSLLAALYYHDHGCFVVPCCTMTVRGKCTFHRTHTSENSIGKVPILGEGWQHARLSREDIIREWTKHPTANVGVLLEASGLLIIDPDSHEAMEETVRNGLPPGPQVKTGGGAHHYYKNPKGIIGLTTRKGESGKIDVLSKGIVVGFGSIHRSGQRYELLVSFEEWPLEDPPLWAERLLLDSLKQKGEAVEIPDTLPPTELDALQIPQWLHAVIRDGQSKHQEPYPSRSEAVWAVLMAMVDAGHDDATIASILLDPRFKISSKPRQQGTRWLAGEIGRARAKAHAKDSEESAPQPGSFRLTDLGNGERLIARYGQDLLFNNLAKKFLTWNGQRWAVDEIQQVRIWARETIRGLYNEVKQLTDAIREVSVEEQKGALAKHASALLRHAVKSESEQRINSLIHNAQMDVPILPKELDADPWSLNCENGTLNLRTGTLHPHRREDRITKLIPIAYDPHATCPHWKQFLSEVMAGNKDLVDFLKKALGYSLTGSCTEDCLFLLFGTGANGKTTFIEIASAVLGDYATTAAFSTFLHQERDSVRNDIADLQGARFVSAVEMDQGKRLSEALIKRLTGKDTVKARFLWQEHFQFKPQLKLWLASNYRPTIQGTDDAIWRRIRLIPFTQKFEGTADDKTLGDKLRAELPGILAWAVRGCLEWQATGLPLPETIKNATAEYKSEMDVLGSFLDECCEKGAHLLVKAGILYHSYVLWAGDKSITQNAFARLLTDRGFGREKSGGAVWRLGLNLSLDHRL